MYSFVFSLLYHVAVQAIGPWKCLFNMNAFFIIFRIFPFSLHRSGIILYVIFYKIRGNLACFCAGFSVFYTSIKYISKKCSKKILGGIAQLARAHGSYPWCRWFKSSFRYLEKVRLYGLFSFAYLLLFWQEIMAFNLLLC